MTKAERVNTVKTKLEPPEKLEVMHTFVMGHGDRKFQIDIKPLFDTGVYTKAEIQDIVTYFLLDMFPNNYTFRYDRSAKLIKDSVVKVE